MVTIHSIVGVFLIVSGFLVKKYPNLIAGYNTMSPEKKEKVDIQGLSTHMRNSMIVMGVLIAVGDQLLGITGLQEHKNGAFISVILIGTFYIWINALTFTNKSNNHSDKNKVRAASMIVVFVVFPSSIFGFIFYGTRPPEFTVSNNQLEISGIHGISTEIIEVKLYESIPKINRKTNGFNYGSTLKGNFHLERIGACILFIESNEGPFIYLETENGIPIILNTESKNKTEELLENLKSEMKK